MFSRKFTSKLETYLFAFNVIFFILKSVIDKVYYNFFFLIYELNAVVSVYSNVFYPATWTLKMLYENFFGARFVTICLFCTFLIH